MTIRQKNKWRLYFKVAAFSLVIIVAIFGSILFYLGKGDGYASFIASIIAFASTVFCIDYSTSPGKGFHK